MLEEVNLSFWSIWIFYPCLGLGSAWFLLPQSKAQPGSADFIRNNVIFNLGNIRKTLRREQQISYKAQSSYEYLPPKVISEGITHFPRSSQHLWISKPIFFITSSFSWRKWKKEVPILHMYLYWMLWKWIFFILYNQVIPSLLLYITYTNLKATGIAW